MYKIKGLKDIILFSICIDVLRQTAWLLVQSSLTALLTPLVARW